MGYDRYKAWAVGRVGAKNVVVFVLFYLFFCFLGFKWPVFGWVMGKRGVGYVQYDEDESCDHTCDSLGLTNGVHESGGEENYSTCTPAAVHTTARSN